MNIWEKGIDPKAENLQDIMDSLPKVSRIEHMMEQQKVWKKEDLYWKLLLLFTFGTWVNLMLIGILLADIL